MLKFNYGFLEQEGAIYLFSRAQSCKRRIIREKKYDNQEMSFKEFSFYVFFAFSVKIQSCTYCAGLKCVLSRLP